MRIKQIFYVNHKNRTKKIIMQNKVILSDIMFRRNTLSFNFSIFIKEIRTRNEYQTNSIFECR